MAKTLRMVLVVAGIGLTTAAGLQARTSKAQAVGIHKIQHVIIVMQENRSFDSYFGTYPGADGIPTQNGVPTICVPDPRTNTCVKPFHDTQDLNQGGPHAAPADVLSFRGQDGADGFHGPIACCLHGSPGSLMHNTWTRDPVDPDCPFFREGSSACNGTETRARHTGNTGQFERAITRNEW